MNEEMESFKESVRNNTQSNNALVIAQYLITGARTRIQKTIAKNSVDTSEKLFNDIMDTLQGLEFDIHTLVVESDSSK